MPNYLLLLYPDQATPEQRAERQAEMPLWLELNESLREAVLSDYRSEADAAFRGVDQSDELRWDGPS